MIKVLKCFSVNHRRPNNKNGVLKETGMQSSNVLYVHVDVQLRLVSFFAFVVFYYSMLCLGDVSLVISLSGSVVCPFLRSNVVKSCPKSRYPKFVVNVR